MADSLPTDDDDLALSNFYDLVQLIDGATCRGKHWRFYRSAPHSLAQLILTDDPHRIGGAAMDWQVWADGKRLLFEAELTARYGAAPPKRDTCPACEVQGVVRHCVFCGWASE
jgi:hypothetical protein